MPFQVIEGREVPVAFWKRSLLQSGDEALQQVPAGGGLLSEPNRHGRYPINSAIPREGQRKRLCRFT